MTSLLLMAWFSLVMPSAAPAQTPAHVGRRVSEATDVDAIRKVTEDFRESLKARDAKRLSGLLLNDTILFASPRSPAGTRKLRQDLNVHADGIPAAGAQDFLRFIATAKVPIEERFYNISIVQDGHLAWVSFDFEFLEDGRVENHGVEVWQMVKNADDAWKILSVVWSSNGAPR